MKDSLNRIYESAVAGDIDDGASSVAHGESLSIHGDDVGSVKSDNSNSMNNRAVNGIASSNRNAGSSSNIFRSNISGRVALSRLPPKSTVTASTFNVPKQQEAGSDHNSSVTGSEPDVMRRNSGKLKRAESDKRQRWCCVDDSHGKESLTELLKSQWLPLLNSASASKLFPKRPGSMECGLEGIAMLENMLVTSNEAYMDNLDLVLKWMTLRLCEKENVQAFAKLLDLLIHTFESVSYLHEII